MKLAIVAFAAWVLTLAMPGVPAALAEGQGIVATVNDRPITTFDINQRMKLLKILGAGGEAATKKAAFQSLVDDTIKITEAKKLGVQPTEKMVDDQIAKMAKGSDTDMKGLAAKYKKQGVSLSALKSYINSQISFQRLYRVKNPEKQITADPALVKREYDSTMKKYNAAVADMKSRYAKAQNDPRRRPITVYQLQEISFPVELLEGEMNQGLVTARAVEVQQFIGRYKGCKSAKSAAEGIFNVKVGKILEADVTKLPKQLRDALDKVGPGGAIGPAMGKGRLQAYGFCGKRTVSPPKLPPMPKAPPPPALKDFEGRALNIAYAEEEQKFLATLRGAAVIDYKDPAYSQ
jgi:peptidyl-prolyl cis-trans isomerase SurA